MIFNIHGFRGQADNSIFEVLLNLDLGQLIISPILNYEKHRPPSTLRFLKEVYSNRKLPPEAGLTIAGKDELNLIIGTSLGGFYAYCLACEFNAKLLLINPCLLPFVYLPTLGTQQASHTREYANLFGNYMYTLENKQIAAIIGNHDEIIDHGFTKRTIENCHIIDGGHSFSDNKEILKETVAEIFKPEFKI
jgi:predicted esterase YcpF (UPF0227 family)